VLEWSIFLTDISPKRNRKRYGQGYRESLSGTIPTKTYRSPKAAAEPSGLEQIVRYLATILSILLVFKLILSLFGLPQGTISLLTGWIISPLSAVFHSTSLATLAALALVVVAATSLIHYLRKASDEPS
jgi:hypothetical protein